MTTALEVRQTSAMVVGGAPAPTPAEWDALQSMASWIFRSRMFSQYNGSEQVMVAMLIGRDLGIAPTAALAKGFIIEDGGRFKFDVEVQVKLAVVQARMPDFRYTIVEWTDEVCSLKGGMKDGQQIAVSVSLEEAKRRQWAIGKSGVKKTYQNNSKDMLMWRAQARLLKLTAGGALYGAIPVSLADSIEEDGDPDERSSAVVVDEMPAGNGVGAVGAAPTSLAAPQVETRNYRLDFITRAKKCGWTTEAKQRDLANNGMRELGLSEVRKASEIGPADWKALFTWLDGRYDEAGKQRPKNGTTSTLVGGTSGDGIAPGVVPPVAVAEIEVPPLPPGEDVPAMSREEFVGIVNDIAQVFASAGHKRTFLTEHPPGSGRLFFMDAALLIEVGSTRNGVAKPFPVYATDDDAAGRNAVCSDAMIEMLLVKLRDAQRGIGR